MSSRKSHFVFVFQLTAVVILISVLVVNGLKCIQCKGNYNLSDDCYNGRVEAEECPNVNHSYCISYSGHLGGTANFLVIRNCSSKFVNIPCRGFLLNNSTDDHLQFCSKSCSTDGCNNDIHYPNSCNANKSSMSFSLLIPLVVLMANIVKNISNKLQ
ncbi:hypothetical protein CHUAL_002635 [Chamberlinius hualienensis]